MPECRVVVVEMMTWMLIPGSTTALLLVSRDEEVQVACTEVYRAGQVTFGRLDVRMYVHTYKMMDICPAINVETSCMQI